MEWKDAEKCARCDGKLRSFHRLYFGEVWFNRKYFVSLCEECHHHIETEIERTRTVCIQKIFNECDREFTIQTK